MNTLTYYFRIILAILEVNYCEAYWDEVVVREQYMLLLTKMLERD
jgi:hypothetical protein